MPTVEKINPAVLEWARVTAGLGLDTAARKLGLTSGPKGSAEEKLAAIEAGEREVTANQVAKMASAYNRPLLALYMAAPPRGAEPCEDFRTIRAATAPDDAARLNALVRDARVRQSILRELIEADDDARPLPFVGSLPITTPIPLAVELIREAVGFAPDQRRRNGNERKNLFRDLRHQIEASGIFVMLLGDLGGWRSAVPASVFRGFAIADDLAPVIILNDQDAKAAWPFTLLHELVHIFVGSTGISGAPTTHEPATPKDRVERYCNDVAGEMLLPADALRGGGPIADVEALLAVATVTAEAWGVSESMAAYRLWRVGRSSQVIYAQAVAIYQARWERLRQQERNRRQDDDGGPSFFVVRRSRLGDAILQTVRAGLRADYITHATAAKVVGVRPNLVEALLAQPGSPRRRAG